MTERQWFEKWYMDQIKGTSEFDALANILGVNDTYWACWQAATKEAGPDETGAMRPAKPKVAEQTPTNSQSAPLEYPDWLARPCARYDNCPVKNKNLHCYANKPCFL